MGAHAPSADEEEQRQLEAEHGRRWRLRSSSALLPYFSTPPTLSRRAWASTAPLPARAAASSSVKHVGPRCAAADLAPPSTGLHCVRVPAPSSSRREGRRQSCKDPSSGRCRTTARFVERVAGYTAMMNFKNEVFFGPVLLTGRQRMCHTSLPQCHPRDGPSGV